MAASAPMTILRRCSASSLSWGDGISPSLFYAMADRGETRLALLRVPDGVEDLKQQGAGSEQNRRRYGEDTVSTCEVERVVRNGSANDGRDDSREQSDAHAETGQQHGQEQDAKGRHQEFYKPAWTGLAHGCCGTHGIRLSGFSRKVGCRSAPIPWLEPVGTTARKP